MKQQNNAKRRVKDILYQSTISHHQCGLNNAFALQCRDPELQ